MQLSQQWLPDPLDSHESAYLSAQTDSTAEENESHSTIFHCDLRMNGTWNSHRVFEWITNNLMINKKCTESANLHHT